MENRFQNFYFGRLLVLAMMLFVHCATAQFELEFQGTVTDTSGKRPFADVWLQVFDSKGNMVKQIQTKSDGVFQFKLSTMVSDKYSVLIKRKGYVTKSFLVSTENIPEKERGTQFPLIIANPSLFKRVPGVDYSALEEPIVVYYYNPATDSYVIDQDHWARMRQKLEKIREQEKRLTH